MQSAFFTLHKDLPREGPGDPDSLNWALTLAKTPPNAKILDAGCGPGADIAGLLNAAPNGHLTAMDSHAYFIDAINATYANDPRVTAKTGDMAKPGEAFDLIWSAGALYFLGIEAGLRGWREALKSGGVVAFSDAIWTSENPSEPAVTLMEEYPAMTDLAGDLTACERAGYEVLGHRMIGDGAWEAYYQPMEKRIADLRPGADEALSKTLDEAEFEIATWRRYRDEFGYVLIVARKI